MPQLMVRHCLMFSFTFDCCNGCLEYTLICHVLFCSGPPKTEAQLKKEAKKREKLEKFQQKKEMEAKKKTQPPAEVLVIIFMQIKRTRSYGLACHLVLDRVCLPSLRKKPNQKRRNWVSSHTVLPLLLGRKKVANKGLFEIFTSSYRIENVAIFYQCSCFISLYTYFFASNTT